MWRGHDNILSDVRTELRSIITEAVSNAREEGILNLSDIPEFPVQKPDQWEHGDLATSLPLMLAREAKMAPRQIAENIVRGIKTGDLIERIEIAGPGFINFFLTNDWLYDLLHTIQDKGEQFGRTDAGKGQKIQVEFVSANPVGPLNVVSARAASVGDCIASLLEASGCEVERESYINDAGGQVDTFARSVDARYRQLLGEDVEFPEDGYHGDYIRDLAREMMEDYGDELRQKSQSELLQIFKEDGLQRIIDGQKKDLREFGVEFDVWTSEKAVRQSGKMDEVLEYIQKHDYTYKHEGAVWFKSTFFGDDRDRVVVKSNGDVTYIVPDWAYHLDKSQRGFTKVIDLWGPDHHGYISRMMSGIQALGLSHDWLEIILVQFVSLLSEGKAVRMSKRAGQFVTLKQLLAELAEKIGETFAVDVARFFFQMRSTTAQLVFDMDLAVQQADVNPVFYLQYAHARICSIFRQAETRGLELGSLNDADASLLVELEERELIKKLAEFPDTIYESAMAREPHSVARYLQDLAAAFHTFYNKRRVLDDKNMEMTGARALLIDCVRKTLQNGLRLLGISAPTSM
ncbi:arginine--tRNA ligase [Candidatus Poribacteria bacterium]